MSTVYPSGAQTFFDCFVSYSNQDRTEFIKSCVDEKTPFGNITFHAREINPDNCSEGKIVQAVIDVYFPLNQAFLPSLKENVSSFMTVNVTKEKEDISRKFTRFYIDFTEV